MRLGKKHLLNIFKEFRFLKIKQQHATKHAREGVNLASNCVDLACNNQKGLVGFAAEDQLAKCGIGLQFCGRRLGTQFRCSGEAI